MRFAPTTMEGGEEARAEHAPATTTDPTGETTSTSEHSTPSAERVTAATPVPVPSPNNATAATPKKRSTRLSWTEELKADVINIAIAEGVPEREGKYGVRELWEKCHQRFVDQLKEEQEEEMTRGLTSRKVRRIVQDVVGNVRGWLKAKPKTGTSHAPPYGEALMAAAVSFIETAADNPSKSATAEAREKRKQEEDELMNAAMTCRRAAPDDGEDEEEMYDTAEGDESVGDAAENDSSGPSAKRAKKNGKKKRGQGKGAKGAKTESEVFEDMMQAMLQDRKEERAMQQR